LIRARLTEHHASGCRPNSRAESFAGPPETPRFPRLASAGTGLLMTKHFSQEALDHQLAAAPVSLQGAACIYQRGRISGCTSRDPPRADARSLRDSGLSLVLVRRLVAAPHCPWTMRAIQAGPRRREGLGCRPTGTSPHGGGGPRSATPKSLLNKYRRPDPLAAAAGALTDGDLAVASREDRVLAFCRRGRQPGPSCLRFNGSTGAGLPVPGTWPLPSRPMELDFHGGGVSRAQSRSPVSECSSLLPSCDLVHHSVAGSPRFSSGEVVSAGSSALWDVLPGMSEAIPSEAHWRIKPPRRPK